MTAAAVKMAEEWAKHRVDNVLNKVSLRRMSQILKGVNEGSLSSRRQSAIICKEPSCGRNSKSGRNYAKA